LTDEEDRVEENTEKEDSDLECAEKIKFSKHIPCKQIDRCSKTGKSEEDNQALILQAATYHCYQVKSWTSSYQELHKRIAQKIVTHVLYCTILDSTKASFLDSMNIFG
jgi:hypothetical protein